MTPRWRTQPSTVVDVIDGQAPVVCSVRTIPALGAPTGDHTSAHVALAWPFTTALPSLTGVDRGASLVRACSGHDSDQFSVLGASAGQGRASAMASLLG
jgi:hypothetical protein